MPRGMLPVVCTVPLALDDEAAPAQLRGPATPPAQAFYASDWERVVRGGSVLVGGERCTAAGDPGALPGGLQPYLRWVSANFLQHAAQLVFQSVFASLGARLRGARERAGRVGSGGGDFLKLQVYYYR